MDVKRNTFLKAAPPTMQDWMRLALDEGRQALAAGEFPVGAVVVCGGRVVAADHNRKEALQDPTAHAELLAIRAAAQKLGRWRLDDCTLYVTAEPCPMCMGAIIQARLAKLVYGAAEKRFGAVETTVDLGRHPMLTNAMEIYAGICENDCIELMKQCFRGRHRRK